MKKRAQRSEEQALIYGVNPLIEALRSGNEPTEILIAEGAREQRLDELLGLARAKNISVKRLARTVLTNTAGTTNHQGVIGLIAASHYADAEQLLDSLSSKINTDSEPLTVVLDGIEDPRNLGAILRTAECAGVAGVFIPERRAAGLNETVAKAAAGATQYVAVARVTNLTRLIEQLKERNVWVVGTAADAQLAYTEWDWQRPAALVLGGEGSGLHRLVRESCDALVRIPMLGRIESLNVAVAAGVILFEARRQRQAKKK